MSKICFLLLLAPAGLYAHLYSELMGGKVLNCEITVTLVANQEWNDEKSEAGGVVKTRGRLYLDTINTKKVVVQVDSYKVIDSRGLGVPTEITDRRAVFDMSAFLLSSDSDGVKDYIVSGSSDTVEAMSAALDLLKVSRFLRSREDRLADIEQVSFSCYAKRSNDSIFVTMDQTSMKGVWASYELGLDSFPDAILWSLGIGDSSAEQRATKMFRMFRDDSTISFQYHLTQISTIEED